MGFPNFFKVKNILLCTFISIITSKQNFQGELPPYLPFQMFFGFPETRNSTKLKVFAISDKILLTIAQGFYTVKAL